MTPAQERKHERIIAPDFIRGAMLLLIAIANVSWYLWGHDSIGTSMHITDGSAADTAMSGVIMMTVDGRIYPMFAFLFGYGMVQYYESRARAGTPDLRIRRQLFRRHWALLLFGFLHALLLFVGDVLGAYAVVGLIVMALIFRRSTQTLVIWLVSLGGLAFFGVMAQSTGMLFLAWAQSTGPSDLAGSGMAFELGAARDLVAGDSNYLLSAAIRAALWAVGIVGQVLFAMYVPICIIGGVLAARYGLLGRIGEHRRLLGRIALGGICLAWAVGLMTALVFIGVIPGGDLAVETLLAPHAFVGLLGGFGYLAALGLATSALARAVPWLVRAVGAVGRRSLSCYLCQSIVMAPLLSAWGLGLGSQIGTVAAVGIAAGTWFVSLVLAVVFEARGWRGPFEVVLRRLTNGKPAPEGAAQSAKSV